MKIGLDFQWNDAGDVRLDIRGKPEFPKLSVKPAVYAFRFIGQDGTTLYVGEADNLQRRAAHYRNPGPTQQTNIRLNERMRAHLASSGRITMHLVTTARIEIDGTSAESDLTSKFARRLLENAALLAAAGTGQKVENL
jgi:hypothetical protein